MRGPAFALANSPLLEGGAGFAPALIRYNRQLAGGHRGEVDSKILYLAGCAIRAESVLLSHNVVE
jgi:hypothetical protein